jgi:hypothetical protein
MCESPPLSPAARLRDYRTLVLSTLLIFLRNIPPMTASTSPVASSDKHS